MHALKELNINKNSQHYNEVEATICKTLKLKLYILMNIVSLYTLFFLKSSHKEYM